MPEAGENPDSSAAPAATSPGEETREKDSSSAGESSSANNNSESATNKKVKKKVTIVEENNNNGKDEEEEDKVLVGQAPKVKINLRTNRVRELDSADGLSSQDESSVQASSDQKKVQQPIYKVGRSLSVQKDLGCFFVVHFFSFCQIARAEGGNKRMERMEAAFASSSSSPSSIVGRVS